VIAVPVVREIGIRRLGRLVIVLLDGERTSALDASAPLRARGRKTRVDDEVDAELEAELEFDVAVGEGRLAADAECATGLDTVARRVGDVSEGE